MLRLAHRILSQPVLPPNRDTDSTAFTKFIEAIRHGVVAHPVFIADNVAELMWRSPDKGWDIHKDLPSLAPPFPWFFVEYQHVLEGDPILQSGWSVQAFDLESEASEVVAKLGAEHVDSTRQKGSRWVVMASLFMVTKRDSSIWFPGYECVLGVAGNGAMCDWRVAAGRAEKTDTPTLPLLLTISFMHCKNVVQANVADAEGPTEKWLRRQRVPRIEYKVLDIDPARSVLRSEGGMDSEGLRRALHICRGHFATYTEDSPLFGKYVGQFWKAAHVRGSIEAGAVVKDYNVKAK